MFVFILYHPYVIEENEKYCLKSTILVFSVVLFYVHSLASDMFQKRGVRGIVETEESNHIDTMFVDRRNKTAFPNGNALVCVG